MFINQYYLSLRFQNYLMRSSIYNTEREKQLNTAVTVTPHYASRPTNNYFNPLPTGAAHITPSSYSTGNQDLFRNFGTLQRVG